MAQSKDSGGSSGKTGGISVQETGGAKPVRRTFPGPRGAGERLRVAVERAAYADLIAHAKSSLNAEVCGVLAGHICEDDEGAFVHVEAMIPGRAASQGSTHVTFTQETWNAIHKALERDHPHLKIVGWYHTHPGFGVEFSEMDLFIQRNFFAAPSQIALVTDPLNGDVAICTNTAQGIEYLERFWVDGREQKCRAPQHPAPSADAPAVGGGAARSSNSAEALETRVGQLLQAVDELRQFHYRFLMTCGILFCIGLIAAVGYTVYRAWTVPLEPPKVNQIVPIPIQVGDKVIIMGVGITSWEVPPELDAMLLKMEKLKREAEEKAAGETNSAAPGTNVRVAPTNAAPPGKKL